MNLLIFLVIFSSICITHPYVGQWSSSTTTTTTLDSVPIGTEKYTFQSYITRTKNGMTKSGVFFQCKSTIREVNFPPDSQLVEIGDFTFQHCALIKTIMIPKGVTRIGVRAFHGAKSLEKLEFQDFPNSALYSIELSAFEGCNFTSFDIPKSVTFLRSTIFSFTPITHLLIPNSVKSLSSHVFFAMFSVQTIEFEEKAKVTEFPSNCFAQCYCLNEVKIPSSLVMISTDNVFTDSVNISFFRVSVGNSVFSADNDGILYNFYKTTIIAVPPLFTSHKEYRISEGITKLSGLSFNNVRNIQKIVLSSTISTIEEGAFASCEDLAEIDASNSAHFAVNSQNALIWKEQNRIIHFPICSTLKTYVVEAGTTAIGKSAFKLAKNLEVVDIKSTVLGIIESGAFEKCAKLRSVINVPSSLKTIGSICFSECNQLSEFDLQNSAIVFLGSYSFYRCQIRFNSLPTSLTTLGQYSFHQNNNLVNVVIPNGCKIDSIHQNLFSRCANLEGVSIKTDTIVLIEDNSFAFCTNLREIVIPNSVKKLIGAVFQGCTALKSAHLSDTLELIGGNCFNNCCSLKDITINGPTIIESYAFDGCKNLETVYFSEKVTEIKNTAFFICENLERFVMSPNNIKYCSVKGVLYSKNMKALVAYPPGNSSHSFSIPDSVVLVDYVAFYGSQKLRHLDIPHGVEKFEFNAFENCDSLLCGSVKYAPEQKQKLLDAKMKEEALATCPTTTFTQHNSFSLELSGFFRILAFNLLALF